MPGIQKPPILQLQIQLIPFTAGLSSTDAELWLLAFMLFHLLNAGVQQEDQDVG